MSRSDAIIQWLVALIIASAAVAASVFVLEIVTAPQSSVMVDLAIVEAHTEHQPTVSDLTIEELAKDFSVAFVFFVIFVTPIIFLFALIPALMVSAILESSNKCPSIWVYATGGLITGIAFSVFVLSPIAPLGQGFFTDADLTPLRFSFLGAVAGLIGGLVLGWRRQSYFRLFLRHQSAE